MDEMDEMEYTVYYIPYGEEDTWFLASSLSSTIAVG